MYIFYRHDLCAWAIHPIYFFGTYASYAAIFQDGRLKSLWSHHPKRTEIQGGWLLTRECVHKLLLYVVVSASGELKKIRECCNFVSNLQALFMRDMRFNCVARFSDGYRGWEGCVCFLWTGVRIFGEIWASLTILPSGESSSKRYSIPYHFRTCFLKKFSWGFIMVYHIECWHYTCVSMGLTFGVVRPCGYDNLWNVGRIAFKFGMVVLQVFLMIWLTFGMNPLKTKWLSQPF